MAEGRKEDYQLPLRFIVPTTASPVSSRESLSCRDSQVSFQPLKGLFLLQTVLMNRLSSRYCLSLWRKNPPKPYYSQWSLLTPKPIPHSTDFTTDIMTEASTPAGISESSHKDFTRQRTMDSISTQTDDIVAATPPEGVNTLRQRLFPMVDDGADFWNRVVEMDFEGKAEKLREYEEGMREIGMNSSAIYQSIMRIDSFISRLTSSSSQTPKMPIRDVKSECVKALISVKDWIITQEEKMSARRRELEDTHQALQAMSRIHQLETKCEGLLYPHILDLRTEYAQTVLERQALELEKRTLEIREEELITHIELAKLRCPREVAAVSKQKRPLSKAIGRWALFSMRNEPRCASSAALALVLLRLNNSKNEENRGKKMLFLKRITRIYTLRERDIKRKYLYHFHYRGLQQHLHLLQRSDYSPSISYMSIGDECSVRSVKGLFQLKSMDFISDSNRNAALIRLNTLSNRIKSKGIKQKQTCILRWKVHSQAIEVAYYRALLRSVDTLLQSIRKSEDHISQETRQIQGRVEAKIAQMAGLLERLMG